MRNCFTFAGERPAGGIRLVPGIDYPEPVLLLGRGERSCLIRVALNKPPRIEGDTLVEASVVKNRRGKNRLASRSGWNGALVRVTARELDFGIDPLHEKLRFWSGGEGTPLFQAGWSADRDKEQLFALEEGGAILVADRCAAVVRLSYEAGNLFVRPAWRDEIADCIVSRALCVGTPQCINWAIAMLYHIDMEHKAMILRERRKALKKENKHASGTI